MSFELNKILGSILTALIIVALTSLISEALVEPNKLPKPAYPIAAEEAAAPAPAADAGPAKPDPIPADLWAKADPAHGAEIAKKCGQCHNFEKGAAAKIGPALYGVVDRPRASVEGFTYSDALKKLGGTWTPQDIAQFIYKPSAYAPGTKMSFAGLPKPEDRADVIAYLNKDSDSPIDLAKAP